MQELLLDFHWSKQCDVTWLQPTSPVLMGWLSNREKGDFITIWRHLVQRVSKELRDFD